MSKRPKPALVIYMEGGLIHEITTTTDMDVLLIDGDTDGIPPEELGSMITNEEAGTKEQVYLSLPISETAPQYVRWRLRNYAKSNGKEC